MKDDKRGELVEAMAIALTEKTRADKVWFAADKACLVANRTRFMAGKAIRDYDRKQAERSKS